MSKLEFWLEVFALPLQAVRRYWHKLCRAANWARYGWSDYDWDYDSVTRLLVHKLSRMEHLFKTQGYHDQSCQNFKPKMQSLRLCILLGRKILEHSYDRALRDFEKEYGPLGHKLEPISDGQSWSMKTTVNGVPISDELSKKFLQAYDCDGKIEARDRRLFWTIIKHYHQYWWD